MTGKNLFYHATYLVHLGSILTNGLGHEIADTHKNWEDSKKGVVCLATDIDIAMSYAETSENAPDEWLDGIVVLAVDACSLDPRLLYEDGNIIGNDGSSVEYHGIIGKEAITHAWDAEGNPLSLDKPKRFSP